MTEHVQVYRSLSFSDTLALMKGLRDRGDPDLAAVMGVVRLTGLSIGDALMLNKRDVSYRQLPTTTPGQTPTEVFVVTTTIRGTFTLTVTQERMGVCGMILDWWGTLEDDSVLFPGKSREIGIHTGLVNRHAHRMGVALAYRRLKLMVNGKVTWRSIQQSSEEWEKRRRHVPKTPLPPTQRKVLLGGRVVEQRPVPVQQVQRQPRRVTTSGSLGYMAENVEQRPVNDQAQFCEHGINIIDYRCSVCEPEET
jgi:hypothetical protein